MYEAFHRLPRGVRRRVVRVATPNYTVGAVVLLRGPGDSLLLLRQSAGPGWSLPGGLLGRLEEPAAGARRELEEETGIRLEPDALRPARPNAVINPRAQQVDCVLTATVDPDELALRLDPVEVLAAEWYARDALPILTGATARLLGHYGLGPRAAAYREG
jgi:8-oxo-dGTP pyrophosphatase MutT (NUDIX family)